MIILGIGLIVYIATVLFMGVTFYLGVYHSAEGFIEQQAVIKLRWLIIYNFSRIVNVINTSLRDTTKEHISDSKFDYDEIKKEVIRKYSRDDYGLMVIARYVLSLKGEK